MDRAAQTGSVSGVCMIFPCCEDKLEIHMLKMRLKHVIPSQWKWGVNQQLWDVLPFLQKGLMDLLTTGRQGAISPDMFQVIPQVLCGVECQERMQAKAAQTN